MQHTEEGVNAVDSAIDFISKHHPVPSLKWNSRIEKLVDPSRVADMVIEDTDIFQMQELEEQHLKSLLATHCDYYYEDFKVFVEYKTPYGFEIVANLLRDDGNEEKDVREALMSERYKSVMIIHTLHATQNMMTYIALLGEEKRMPKAKRGKTRKDASILNDTADVTQPNIRVEDTSQLQLLNEAYEPKLGENEV